MAEQIVELEGGLIPRGTDGLTFVKDMLPVGELHHPNGAILNFTEDDLQGFADRFNAQSEAGIKHDCVVDHSDLAEAVIGKVEDAFVQDGKLWAVHRFADADAAKTATRCGQTSVMIEDDYTDSTGKKWGRCIVNNSVVQQPVYQTQSPFIALSRHGKACTIPVFTPQKADTNSQEVPEMKIEDARKALGKSADGADEATILSMISANAKTAEEAAESATKLSRTTTDLATAKARVSELEAKHPDAFADPNMGSILAENAEMKLSKLVDAGKLSPAAKDAIIASVGTAPVMLSRNGEAPSRIDGLIAALESNHALPGKVEKTPAQILSRSGAPSDEEAKAARDATIARLSRLSGVEAAK